MDMLGRIVAQKRIEIERRKRQAPPAVVRGSGPRPRFETALAGPAPAVIAEFKRRSPSKGVLAGARSLEETVRDYAANGAAALSILTDGEFFGGRDSDLAAARSAAGLPILRKDFTLDVFQIAEARALGADAILLIVAILDHIQLRDLLTAARQSGLDALVEVHDERELDLAIAAGASIIGVNNRDLRTFEVSLETCLRLRPRIPAHCTAVAESGIRTRADVERLAQAGFHALLVGESLLTSGDPGAKLRELLGRGS